VLTRQAARVVDAGGTVARGCYGDAIAMVAIDGPRAGLIMVLRRHLPFDPKAFLVLLALSDESR